MTALASGDKPRRSHSAPSSCSLSIAVTPRKTGLGNTLSPAGTRPEAPMSRNGSGLLGRDVYLAEAVPSKSTGFEDGLELLRDANVERIPLKPNHV